MKPRGAWALFLLALVTYTQDIFPILNTHCIECHSIGASLNLSRFPFLSKATEDQAAIVERILIRTAPGSATMPPGNRPKLTSDQADTIRQWRDEGLPF
jgi:mono/diheme cytochrome c family protein